MNPPPAAPAMPVSGGLSGISGVSGIDQQPGIAAATPSLRQRLLRKPLPEKAPPLLAVLWRHRQHPLMSVSTAQALLTSKGRRDM